MQNDKTCEPRCHIPWQQMVIDSTGRVSPCAYLGAYGNASDIMGNVNDQTVEEIWNGEGYAKLRKAMASGNLAVSGCDKCYAIKQGLALSFAYDKDCESETGPRTAYARNIEILKREIREGATHLEARPTIVSFSPSHRCNIRCVHCYQTATRKSELRRSRAEQEVEDLVPSLVQLIAGGGEPFLLTMWKRFLKNFTIEQNPYLDFATTTNATLVTRETVEALAKFKKLSIIVSLDAVDEQYEKVRIGAKFEPVKLNIRKFCKAVEAAPDKTSNMGISSCVMKSTICFLPDFVRFATDERLAFVLSPVLTFPPDQSLICFNEDPALEMEGWAAALDETQRIIETQYLPAMVKQRGQVDVTQTEIDFWRQNLKLIRDAIPFEMADTPHHRVSVSLPPGYLAEMHPELTKKDERCLYIFPLGQRDKARYWAEVKDDGSFEISLPPGQYTVNGASKWGAWLYWDHVRFVVPEPAGKEDRSSSMPPAVQAHYHYERPGHVLAKVQRVRDKAQRLMGSAAK